MSNVTKKSMITGHFKRHGQLVKKKKEIYDIRTGNGILSNYCWGMRQEQRRQQAKRRHLMMNVMMLLPMGVMALVKGSNSGHF